jgi:acetyltransferase-like isoleucine patch superfamily enzyme
MHQILRKIIRSIYYRLKFLYTVLFLSAKKVAFGKRPLFMQGTPIIRAYGSISIGDDFRISCNQFKTELFSGKNAVLIIGNNVFINRGVSISASLSIEIGNDCLIGDMVSIQDSNWHEVMQGGGVKTAGIKIGKNVWIGKNAIILPGVNIGDHSVIAAGSVISNDIPQKSRVYQERITKIKNLTCDDDYRRT